MPGIVKRSLVIAGHRTSISLEEPFWQLLRRIAAERDMPVSSLVAEIDRSRTGVNLSSAIRVFLFEWLMARAIDGAESQEAPEPQETQI